VATDFEGLIPTAVADELIAAAENESVAMRFGNVQRMPTGVESVPVVAVEPDAEWVDPRYSGRKKATTIEWSASRLEAEELACVLAVPQVWIDDTSFDVWAAVRARLASAFAKRIDETVLFAVAPVPASFPPGGVAGVAGAALTGTDALAAINTGMAALEAQGLVATGVAARPIIGSALRTELRTIGSLPSESPSATIYGVPVGVPAYWPAQPTFDGIVGDWQKLVIGVRQDIRFETSTDAVLQDAAGAIIANAFQDDLVAMRCYLRMGCAIGRPVGGGGTPVNPFATLEWAATAAAAETARSSRAKA
jgi:Phage capsid family